MTDDFSKPSATGYRLVNMPKFPSQFTPADQTALLKLARRLGQNTMKSQHNKVTVVDLSANQQFVLAFNAALHKYQLPPLRTVVVVNPLFVKKNSFRHRPMSASSAAKGKTVNDEHQVTSIRPKSA